MPAGCFMMNVCSGLISKLASFRSEKEWWMHVTSTVHISLGFRIIEMKYISHRKYWIYLDVANSKSLPIRTYIRRYWFEQTTSVYYRFKLFSINGVIYIQTYIYCNVHVYKLLFINILYIGDLYKLMFGYRFCVYIDQ